uniref:DUF4371 domain-containing protein n=1 Tax=Amphimedon queenslandica TaxID=400682 RepID=A0A1X7VIF7_AMPQE
MSEFKAKRIKRDCNFDKNWVKELHGNTYARCTLCCSNFSISHGGRNDVTTHVHGKHNMEMAKAASSSRCISSMFKPNKAAAAIKAEAVWSMFVAKHNLTLLTSDHANKLFPKMFPDSEIAKQFSCGRTKPTAVVKQALAPHSLSKVASVASNSSFSLLMDGSNDKTDKSCIILEWQLIFFAALKSSLESQGLQFSYAMAFMCDTTNVMKGARSGVQKLLKDGHLHLYDVGCICHLADLTQQEETRILRSMVLPFHN